MQSGLHVGAERIAGEEGGGEVVATARRGGGRRDLRQRQRGPGGPLGRGESCRWLPTGLAHSRCTDTLTPRCVRSRSPLPLETQFTADFPGSWPGRARHRSPRPGCYLSMAAPRGGPHLLGRLAAAPLPPGRAGRPPRAPPRAPSQARRRGRGTSAPPAPARPRPSAGPLPAGAGCGQHLGPRGRARPPLPARHPRRRRRPCTCCSFRLAAPAPRGASGSAAPRCPEPRDEARRPSPRQRWEAGSAAKREGARPGRPGAAAGGGDGKRKSGRAEPL